MKKTTYNEWKVYPETQRGKKVWSIRRYVTNPDGTKDFPRYKSEDYNEIKTDEAKVRDLAIILNNRVPAAERAKERITIEHAYITEARIEDFQNYVNSKGTDQSNGIKAKNYVVKYFIHFFLSQLGISNPNKWHKYQNVWGCALLNQLNEIRWSEAIPKPPAVKRIEDLRVWPKEKQISYYTIIEIIFTANRFLTWLSSNHPETIDNLLAFAPIADAKLTELKAITETPSQKRKWFITDGDWIKIQKHIKGSEIEAVINLIYLFGLRRREGLSLVLTDVKKHGLLIERQLVGYDDRNERITKVPKKGKHRSVEYWSMTTVNDFAQKQTYGYVKMQTSLMTTPDKLSKTWAKIMEALSMPYHLHDLRRTWITKAFRDPARAPDRIRINAGHSELSTTMRYNLNESMLQDETWVPSDDELDE